MLQLFTIASLDTILLTACFTRRVHGRSVLSRCNTKTAISLPWPRIPGSAVTA